MKYIMAFCLLWCMQLTLQAQFKKLVWSDEFNYTGLPDSTKWGYDTGGHGWGNNEKQFYTDARLQNAFVKDGKLTIRAIKEKYENNGFTSARLITKNKGDWKYGRIEVKALLPHGRGIWPAIWMLPTNWEYGSWPHSGEIDIMEHVGYLPDSVFGTVHTLAYHHSIGTHKSASILKKDLSKKYHIYALEWTENEMKMLVDEQVMFTFKNEKTGSAVWPFDKEFHLLLNVAVGGDWGGSRGIDESVYPQQMVVDYVRVYQ